MPRTTKTIEELQKECEVCRKHAERNYETIDPKFCSYSCPTGLALHELEEEDPKWKKIDWNSARYEKYYHH